MTTRMNLAPLTRFYQRSAHTWRRFRRALALTHHADDLHDAFADRPEDRPLTPQERALLENTLAFGARLAGQVGVPRAEIVALPEAASLTETLRLFATTAHSRLPVVGPTLDDVRGVVNLKDVVGFVHSPNPFSLTSLLQPPLLVPEGMPLIKVLQHMRAQRLPLALVTDEFGGVSGLVGLKDIVAELLGDLAPEDDDSDAAPEILSLGQGTFRVRGTTPLPVLDAALSLQLAKHYPQAETLAGVVLQHAQHVPPVGTQLTLPSGLTLTIHAADPRRLHTVDVHVA